MLFLVIVSSIGILFLLNTLWNLYRKPRGSRRKGMKAEIIRFIPRTLRPSELGEAGRPSAGKESDERKMPYAR
jgi:hypothetical protein